MNAKVEFDGEKQMEPYVAGRRVATSIDPKLVRLNAPAVILTDPKFPHNVGQALRLASCYGVETLITSGKRVPLQPDSNYRLPREERMRGYRDVRLLNADRPFDLFDDATFVAVEIRDNAESLPFFEHPLNPVYVFGPEDGSLGRPSLTQCSRFITIPTEHCLNLATAVGTVLYDRRAKQLVGGK